MNKKSNKIRFFDMLKTEKYKFTDYQYSSGIQLNNFSYGSRTNIQQNKD